MSSDVCVVKMQVTGSGNMCADKIVGTIIHKHRPMIGSMPGQANTTQRPNVGQLFCRVFFSILDDCSKIVEQ